jgi:hypothetical protein
MLVGADRIDLIGGGGSFVLTPYLALTPLVLLAEVVWQRLERRHLQLPPRALVYVIISSALVTVVLISVVNALDTRTSAARALLLTADVGGTFAIVLVCRARPNAARTLARGASACLILFVAFDVAEALWWIGNGPETLRFGTIVARFGALQNVGPIPRLAGPVSDANRAGFVLLFYGLLISFGEPHPWLRRIALTLVGGLLLVTISRSAWLGALAMLLVAVIHWKGRVPVTMALASTIILGTGLVLFLANPEAVERVAFNLTTPATQRLSSSEGSAQSHLALIERGLADATASVPNALVGIGYGNSHLMLQDVFPGNKYGNFHSLYVSMFAESGVFALALVLILMLTPLIAGGPWRPLIAGAVVFNIFYQTPTEPAFWFALAAAWLAMPTRARARRPGGGYEVFTR